MNALELTNLTLQFGGLTVTNDVSLSLEKGARHALIGPNGAGKTTLINLITGRLMPRKGSVLLDGADMKGLPQHRRTRMGLVRNFQVTNLFTTFTAMENIALAISEREGFGFSVARHHGFPAAVVKETEEIASRMRLSNVPHVPVRDLAYGQQRLVELGVAMALKPKVLLLDEPAAGLPSGDHEVILGVLNELPEDVAVLLVEHDMPLVFSFARQITVLAEGRVIARGTPDEIRLDPQVRTAYLGNRS
jgi:branched-chain amino acid transport system ATP-binding protein